MPDPFLRSGHHPRATLALIADGAPRRPRRAQALVVSHETVKSHVRALLLELDARDRTQAVIVAYEAGLTS